MRVLPLPLGEVPEAERAIFTLSVGFAASSPSGGAKGETDCHVDPQGLLAMTSDFCTFSGKKEKTRVPENTGQKI